MFLAAIIPRKEKEKIRQILEIGPRSAEEGLNTVFLGINVRNTLRMCGFPFDSLTLDIIWYEWLKEAVNLPEEDLHLPDSVKRAIRKCKAQVKSIHKVKRERCARACNDMEWEH